jgi:hypothetical protein
VELKRIFEPLSRPAPLESIENINRMVTMTSDPAKFKWIGVNLAWDFVYLHMILSYGWVDVYLCILYVDYCSFLLFMCICLFMRMIRKLVWLMSKKF